MHSMAEIFSPVFTKVASGLAGAEGPVFTAGGAKFFMVAPEIEVNGRPAGEVLHLDLASKSVDRWCLPASKEYGGIPAGCQCDRDGNIWIADMRLGLLKVNSEEKDQFAQMALVDSTGRTMQGCNDLAFDSTGNLWITAPAGEIAPAEYKRSMEEGFGSIYCYTPSGDMLFLETGYRFSNGIAVTKDDKTLIVAETPTKSLWAYDIQGPGKIANKRLWAKLPGDHEGGPDGMDFDELGRLLVANWGSSHLDVFSPAGELVKRVKCPFTNPSNVHFCPDSRTVYVTEHEFHGVWRFDWECRGQAQYCDQKKEAS